MDVTSDANSVLITSVSQLMAVQIEALSDADGSFNYVWKGIAPCGAFTEFCEPLPTAEPSSIPSGSPSKMPSVSPSESSPSSNFNKI